MAGEAGRVLSSSGVSFTATAVRRCRERRQWSARQLSAYAGQSPSYVGKLETGQVEPSFRAFAKLVAALELSPLEVWVLVMREAGAVPVVVTPSAYGQTSEATEAVG